MTVTFVVFLKLMGEKRHHHFHLDPQTWFLGYLSTPMGPTRTRRQIHLGPESQSCLVGVLAVLRLLIAFLPCWPP